MKKTVMKKNHTQRKHLILSGLMMLGGYFAPAQALQTDQTKAQTEVKTSEQKTNKVTDAEIKAAQQWQVAWTEGKPGVANGKAGFVDQNGDWVIKPQYDDAEPFNENGLAMVGKGDSIGYINTRGKVIVPIRYVDRGFERFSHGLASVKFGGVGLVNTEGKEIIPLEDSPYTFISPFRNGLAQFWRYDNHNKGYLNTRGEEVLELSSRYDEFEDFSDNGLALVGKNNNQYGFINKKGEEVIPLQYDQIYGFYNKPFAIVKKGDKWGAINSRGEVVVPLEYDYLSGFDEGVSIAGKDGKAGLINAQGKTVVPFGQYDKMKRRWKGMLTAVKKDGKYGLIDTEGKVVIPLEYDDVQLVNENMITIKKGDKWGIIDTDNKVIVPFIYDEDILFGFNDNGLAIATRDSKWTFVNTEGKETIPLQDYDDMEGFFDNGLVKVRKGEFLFYVDKYGRCIKYCL